MVDSEGVPFAILATSRDVTERRQASESLETMAHEMRHRLRNAFAVSGAIALASAREDPGHREFAEALAQRYNSLSMVQSQLINQGDEQSLDALVTQLISAFDRDGGSFQVSAIPSVMLDEQQVRLVALVLGELSTNSLKHGALREGLPIRLSATRGDCTVILEWGEDLPNDPARDEETVKGSGSGHGLMQRMARAHGGGLEIEITADKLSARLEIRA
jgi:two-component sensor histidine kinase